MRIVLNLVGMAVFEKSRFQVTARLSVKALEARCRAKGVHMGPQRRAVARVLAGLRGPFGFDDVLKRARHIAPRISRGTIYLALRRFRAVGLIRAVAASNRRKEARGNV